MNGDSHTTVERVDVALGDRSYGIFVGPGLLDQAGTHMRPVLAQRRVVVVTDATVAKLHLDRLNAALDRADIAHDHVVLPPGESTKDFAHLQQLADALLDRRVERRTMLVALGGGVIGDLTGVAAALVLRGLDFVQVPTTLLSQVDSSVGGKTAIDTPRGKNLIGAFHQPRLVLADLDVLATLPARELACGYAEIIKYGLLGDFAFFEWLEANVAAVLARDVDALVRAVGRSVEMKAEIVAEDEKEAGRRALLNLGHTFGHAIEAEMGFGEALKHGEAVGVGMAQAFRFSANQGLCSGQDAARAEAAIKAAGLPTTLADVRAEPFPADALIAHCGQDKKAEGGKLTFVLARGIGDAFVAKDVDREALRAFLLSEGAA